MTGLMAAHFNNAVMSSREIAELTGKRHDHVMRDIRSMLGQLNVPAPNFEATYFDAQNQERPCFNLDRIHVECLLTGYSIPLRMKVLERLKELEAGQQTSVPSSFAEALRLAADQQEKIALLANENQQQSQKIDSLEKLFKEGMTPTQFCKGLNGVNVMAISECLMGRNWLFNESKSSTRWRTASYARDRYLTEHQSEITPHGQEPFIKYTPVLLRKGAARLHELYLAGELPMKKTWDGQYTHEKAEVTV